MSNEEIRAMLELFARQLEIAAELKQLREGNK
jgi:GAF domain-containing protein